MKRRRKHIRIMSNQYSISVYKQYLLSKASVLKLREFLKNEFNDLANLKIESSTRQMAIEFISKSTSIGDVWTAIHLYLKIPYRDSARFPGVENKIINYD